jgi:acetyl esterase/lipase
MNDKSEERVDENGVLRVPAFALPPSPDWSPQARKVFFKRFTNNPVAASRTSARAAGSDEERWLEDQRAYRAGMEFLHGRLVARMRVDHDVQVEEATIGGVRVEVVTPTSGIRNASQVLLNLHGGAFVGGAEYCGLVESIPIATTGGCKVITIDYRQGWEHRFPAASEDVAAVYEAVLSDHRPQAVGVFGYSAGASLTAQAVSWFLSNDLPNPGAVAMCSGGAGTGFGGGDGAYFGAIAMGDAPPPVPTRDDAAVARFGYLAGVDPRDSLVAPGEHPEVLAHFPPSLVLSGTRSFDLSRAVTTHRRLLAAGASCELHVWEGLWHCFPYHHDLPESQDAYRTLTGFFDRTLS